MLLHSVYVVGALVAMPLCVNYLVPTQLRSTGQGLATMVISQPGRWICSTFVAGWLIDHFDKRRCRKCAVALAPSVAPFCPLLVPKVTPNLVE
ncbi:MAG: hypothetical protein CM1200mP29_04960 [Verrucomicrobiota bacterium]|nr:MAG: hypothetical protein CM1200mP29_04960 [Verrucomicrobiota bacterium]